MAIPRPVHHSNFSIRALQRITYTYMYARKKLSTARRANIREESGPDKGAAQSRANLSWVLSPVKRTMIERLAYDFPELIWIGRLSPAPPAPAGHLLGDTALRYPGRCIKQARFSRAPRFNKGGGGTFVSVKLDARRDGWEQIGRTNLDSFYLACDAREDLLTRDRGNYFLHFSCDAGLGNGLLGSL